MNELAPCPSLQDVPSNGLLSLWDMLRAYASEIIVILEILADVQKHLANRRDHPLPRQSSVPGGLLVNALLPQPNTVDDFFPFLEKTLGLLPRVTQWLPMPSVDAQISRIQSMMRLNAPAGEITQAVEELINRFKDELIRKLFVHVRFEHANYYSDQQLFGQEVSDIFPSAIDDIEGAGKCLALGQGTATVMHLMRVMEVGLRALAKALRIPYAPSWESYLSQIQTKIGAKHKTKKIQWKRDEAFFRDVSGDLMTVKQAWRNPSMHIVRKFSQDEAEEIFKAVRAFMKRLATRLK